MLPGNAPTPLDIPFRVAGFPARVSPWFWLTMALLGGWTLDDRELGPIALVVWVAAAFVSILVHELGHAVTARQFRAPTEIVLGVFGGFAQYYDRLPPPGWRKLLVSLMGPAAGFLLLGLVVVSEMSVGWMGLHPVLERFGFFVGVQCLIWGLFNLLPIWPLDGGQALREVFYVLGLRRPDPAGHMVSVFTAGLLVILGVTAIVDPLHPVVAWLPIGRSPIMVVFFVLLAVQNWQMLQQYNNRRSWEFEDREPWR